MSAGGPIVLVDDDDDHRWVLCILLEGVGYDVVSLAGGAALLDYLAEGGRPGLVILDLNMPDMSGEAVHEALRAEFERLQARERERESRSPDGLAAHTPGDRSRRPPPDVA